MSWKKYWQNLSQSQTGKKQHNLSTGETSESQGTKSYAVRAPSEGEDSAAESRAAGKQLLASGLATGTGYSSGEGSIHTYSASYPPRPTKTWWNEGLSWQLLSRKQTEKLKTGNTKLQAQGQITFLAYKDNTASYSIICTRLRLQSVLDTH